MYLCRSGCDCQRILGALNHHSVYEHSDDDDDDDDDDDMKQNIFETAQSMPTLWPRRYFLYLIRMKLNTHTPKTNTRTHRGYGVGLIHF